eukprot:2486181-Pleurochrysis_carterae.AAC.16
MGCGRRGRASGAAWCARTSGRDRGGADLARRSGIRAGTCVQWTRAGGNTRGSNDVGARQH